MHKTLLPISTPALIAVALLPSSPCSAQSKYDMAAGSILSGSVHDNFFEAASLRPAMTGLLVLEAVERTIWFHNSADICAPSPVQRQGTNPSTNGSTLAINDDSERSSNTWVDQRNKRNNEVGQSCSCLVTGGIFYYVPNLHYRRFKYLSISCQGEPDETFSARWIMPEEVCTG